MSTTPQTILPAKLLGKVALITGGSRGIGKAIAISLAELGADVVINYRSRKDEADEVVKELQRIGRKAAAVQADVSLSSEVNRMKNEIEATFAEPISILVNNAGIATRHKFEDIGEAEWDEVMDVNLRSAFLVTKAFLEPMRKQMFGRIIFMSSIAARTGGVVGPHYTASKAGLIGLMHYFAKNFGAEGITSNAIAPAFIETEMAQGVSVPSPIGRIGRPEEVAAACALLATNGFIHGQTIQVDGGLYLT